MRPEGPPRARVARVLLAASRDGSRYGTVEASPLNAYDCVVTSGTLIREARLRAGLSQVELAQRSGKDRAQLARWERDVVQPSFETLRELVRACGFDLETSLVPYEPEPARDAQLQKTLRRSPQERLQAMLRARNR